MKNFYDVYNSKLSEAELPTLYCDMDQVLCNFLDGAEKVLGKSFIEFDKDRRWPLIHDKKDFWETLEWMPVQRDYGLLWINMTHIYYLHIQNQIVIVYQVN